jgi:hypothetical protein
MSAGTGRVEPDPERWLVPLPRGVRPPMEVFVSGVPQSAGVDYDYEQRGDTGVLAFRRPLQREGRLGFWRWTLMFFSIAGTYRRDDSVDVRYTVDDQPRVATGLEIVPPRARSGDEPAREGPRRAARR